MNFLGLLLLVVALEPGAYAQTGAEREIRKAEATMTEAFAANNYPVLDRLWSPQLVVNSPANRVLHKPQVIAFMHAGGFKYSSYEQTVESVAIFGDTAIAMGHELMTEIAGPLAGKPYQLRYTDVWQRAGDAWVMIARQGTEVTAK